MKQRILVVEDEESLIMLVTIILTAQGYEVVGARDGGTALRELAGGRFDLVLLDVMLPDMDGFDICRKIREEPVTSQLPVIMLTARKSRGDQSEGRQAGADAFITKPFKGAAVVEAMRALIGSNQ